METFDSIEDLDIDLMNADVGGVRFEGMFANYTMVIKIKKVLIRPKT